MKNSICGIKIQKKDIYKEKVERRLSQAIAEGSHCTAKEESSQHIDVISVLTTAILTLTSCEHSLYQIMNVSTWLDFMLISDCKLRYCCFFNRNS